MTIFELTNRHILMIDGEPYKLEKEIGVKNSHISKKFKKKTGRGVISFVRDEQVIRCAGGWKVKTPNP